MIYRSGLSGQNFQDTAVSIIGANILRTVDDKGQASLLLSGGSTPGPIYERLAGEVLPWNCVSVGLADERWVDENDAGSNAALIRKTLLRNQAAKAAFVPMKTQHDTAVNGRNAVEKLYKPLVSSETQVVLGMGSDGHICSWFPAADGTARAVDPSNEDNVQAVMAKRSDVTGDYLERMTLTLSALMKAGSLLLLITGQEKRRVLDHALETHSTDLPISHLLRAVTQGGRADHLTILHRN